MATETVCSRLFDTAKRTPHAPAYFIRRNGTWIPTSYRTYAEEVRQVAKALIATGFEAGQTSCILGFNRPEWTIMNMGTMAAGGAPAGIYTTSSPDEVQYIVNHAEAPTILLEDEGQLAKVLEVRDRLPKLKQIVLMKGNDTHEDKMVLTWEEFLAKGDGVEDDKVDGRLAALEPDDLATLIYTSGTTGPPKGVMLTHQNLAWTSAQAVKLISARTRDCALSYLPLSHIAEQMFSMHGAVSAGYSVYFAESIDSVPDNLKEVQPTIFFGVPRIWEKFHAGISAKLALATGVKKRLVDFAQEQGRRATKMRQEGKDPSKDIQYRLANKVIFSKLKPAVGLGRARVCVSGAAPISKEILEFFSTLDIVVLEVYGQSEDTGPTTFNTPTQFQFGSVGPSFPGVEVKIAEDGEILVKGPNVFKGYYKEKAATDETLIDGWLHSGDLGSFDDRGFLTITGRKKDIIITAGGKNIAPKNIEASLKNSEFINEAVVIGDRRKFLSALVTIDPEAAERHGYTDVTNNAQLRAEVQKAVDETNKLFARVEQIKKFVILPRNLTVEDGELTPTLKVKRRIVNQNWTKEIESMYEDSTQRAHA